MKKFALLLLFLILIMCGCQQQISYKTTSNDEMNNLGNKPATPADVVNRYLQASKEKDWESVFSFYDVPDDITFDQFISEMKASDGHYLNYKVEGYKITGDKTAVVYVSYTYQYDNGKTFSVNKEQWSCVKKDGKWFVGWLPRQ